jgi:cytochrome b subunit of formate dehydrogenase
LYLRVELSDIAVFLAAGNILLEAVVEAVHAVAWLLLAAYLQFTFGWHREEWFPVLLRLWWSHCHSPRRRREKRERREREEEEEGQFDHDV